MILPLQHGFSNSTPQDTVFAHYLFTEQYKYQIQKQLLNQQQYNIDQDTNININIPPQVQANITANTELYEQSNQQLTIAGQENKQIKSQFQDLNTPLALSSVESLRERLARQILAEEEIKAQQIIQTLEQEKLAIELAIQQQERLKNESSDGEKQGKDGQKTGKGSSAKSGNQAGKDGGSKKQGKNEQNDKLKEERPKTKEKTGKKDKNQTEDEKKKEEQEQNAAKLAAEAEIAAQNLKKVQFDLQDPIKLKEQQEKKKIEEQVELMKITREREHAFLIAILFDRFIGEQKDKRSFTGIQLPIGLRGKKFLIGGKQFPLAGKFNWKLKLELQLEFDWKSKPEFQLQFDWKSKSNFRIWNQLINRNQLIRE
ncbi:MAG: hypothetical protein EZS28_034491 [Streblomastix strix]|uniref:Uncharacterized protein n=1 Tax=Streblomastix strix TaxID=222440 RepID=A0A5J4UJA4_9EUKA|nr:MAG: hypothetical protein EZS28_034491 [Streblomastix strix]